MQRRRATHVWLGGHALPPFIVGTRTCMNRDREPAPHCEEHMDHGEKRVISQSTGAEQFNIRHGRAIVYKASVGAGAKQPPPLVAGVVMTIDAYCWPPPHETEQADHAPYWYLQSTGHGTPGVSHVPETLIKGLHKSPPNVGS